MPLMNYRTRVNPGQTIAEISTLLVNKGARTITSEFDDAGQSTGVSFTMPVAGVAVRFTLPVNVEGVARALARGGKQVPKQARDRAGWVAWRILKDWIEAQVALIESNQAEPAQVFMPYAIDASGRTAYQHFVETTQKQLGAGK